MLPACAVSFNLGRVNLNYNSGVQSLFTKWWINWCWWGQNGRQDGELVSLAMARLICLKWTLLQNKKKNTFLCFAFVRRLDYLISLIKQIRFCDRGTVAVEWSGPETGRHKYSENQGGNKYIIMISIHNAVWVDTKLILFFAKMCLHPSPNWPVAQLTQFLFLFGNNNSV